MGAALPLEVRMSVGVGGSYGDDIDNSKSGGGAL